MKTKKILIAVFTAALFTAFMIGCNVPLDNTGLDIGKVQPTPDKKVKIRFNIVDSKSNARTIRPDTSDYQSVEDFDYFYLLVHNNDSNYDQTLTSPFDDYFTYFDLSTGVLSVDDPDENYTFTLLACDVTKTKYLAWGETNKLIPTAFDGTVDIELKEFVADGPSSYDGDGTFKWNVADTLLATYETAELKLYALAGTLLYTEDLLRETSNILDNNIGQHDVASGYYRMTLELGKEGFQTVFVQEIVHIYSGFESEYKALVATDLPTLRNIRYTLTYNYGSDNASGTLSGARPASQSIDHGDSFSTIITNTNPAHSTDSSTDDYDFDAWYTDSGTSDIIDTQKVLGPTTLYAGWIPTVTPVASDFNKYIESPQLEGDPFVAPIITPIGGKSGGTITRYYTNTVGPSSPTTTPPSVAGIYTVTFNVAKDKGWRAITDASTGGGLLAGTLIISAAKTPTADDYNIVIASQRFGSVSANPVSITPKVDSGTVLHIYYESVDGGTAYPKDDAVPTAAGRYNVTFDVDAATGWSSTTDLYAGVLNITYFFAVELAWTGANPPTYNKANTTKNYMEYDETTGALEIRIEIEGNYNYGTYVWNVDFDQTHSEIGDGTKVLRISKNINTPGVDLRWFEVGEYGFTLLAGSESATFTLTSDLTH